MDDLLYLDGAVCVCVLVVLVVRDMYVFSSFLPSIVVVVV